MHQPNRRFDLVAMLSTWTGSTQSINAALAKQRVVFEPDWMHKLPFRRRGRPRSIPFRVLARDWEIPVATADFLDQFVPDCIRVARKHT